jgi:hypothetical protein
LKTAERIKKYAPNIFWPLEKLIDSPIEFLGTVGDALSEGTLISFEKFFLRNFGEVFSNPSTFMII